MTKAFHSKIWDTKRFKRIIKFRNYPPSVNLSLRCWFSEAAVRRCFSKQVLLKILQYSLENTCSGPCIPFFTEHLRRLLLDFRGSKYFFSAKSGIYCWQSHRLCSELLWKHELNLRSSRWNSSVKKVVLRNFATVTRKNLCWSLFLIEL